MICSRSGSSWYFRGLAFRLSLFSFIPFSIVSAAQNGFSTPLPAFYINCASSVAGDGSIAHPWGTLAAAQAHTFAAGDRIALARGTVCQGNFSPQGSGAE